MSMPPREIRLLVEPVAAQRWVARARMDENTCQPCADNNGQTYRNRADAYADYPGGSGYIHCQGRTNCRCVVTKRRGNTNQMMSLAAGLVGSQAFSARALAATNLAKLGMSAPAADTPVGFRAAAPTTDQNAALYIYDAIGGWDGIQPIDVVRALAGVTGPLDVHVNSGGGSIFDGTAIFNAIDGYSGGPKTAYVDGVAASAASFIMLACDEVVVADNAVVMVHDGAGIAIGTADDMRDLADVLDMLSDTIAGIYAKKSGGVPADWRDGDTWYNAEQTVAAGLADRMSSGAMPPATPPDEPMPEPGGPMMPDNLLSVFTVRVDDDASSAAGSAPLAAVSPLMSLDVEGLREALRGAFA